MADTYTLKFRNSREDKDILLHPEADLAFCRHHMGLYVESWEAVKYVGDRVRRGRNWVMLERAEGYTLKVSYTKNKPKKEVD